MGRRGANQPGYDDLIESMVADYRAGSSRRALSQKYGVSMPTVKSWLGRSGTELRAGAEQSRKHNVETQTGRVLVDVDQEQLRHLYCDKLWSVLTISRALGVSEDTVNSRLRLFKIDRDEKAALAARNARKSQGASQYIRDNPESRRGENNAFNNPEVQAKARQAKLDKYGTLWHLDRETISLARQQAWTEDARRVLGSAESMSYFMTSTDSRTVPLISGALGVSQDVVRDRLMKYDLFDFIDTSYHTSLPERELASFVRSFGVRAEKRTDLLSGKQEIDVYCPEHRIGFEFNGSWTHCEARRQDARGVHLKKTLAAEKNGIFLYHVFEYEWDSPRQRPIVESQIRNLLGDAKNKVYARKCVIGEVPIQDATKFLDTNHMQGRAGSAVRYGLYCNGKLVALMTFGKVREQRRDDPVEWELIRYAVKLDTSVVGGASRLFKHFVREHSPTSIVSYSDRAKTRGTLYPNLGFELTGTSSPEYVWWKGDTVLRRYRTMKYKLLKEFPQFSDDMSEADIMKARGFNRIYGCGNKVWTWRAPVL